MSELEDKIRAELSRINCHHIIWRGGSNNAAVSLLDDGLHLTGLGGNELYEALKSIPENASPELASGIMSSFRNGMEYGIELAVKEIEHERQVNQDSYNMDI